MSVKIPLQCKNAVYKMELAKVLCVWLRYHEIPLSHRHVCCVALIWVLFVTIIKETAITNLKEGGGIGIQEKGSRKEREGGNDKNIFKFKKEKNGVT